MLKHAQQRGEGKDFEQDNTSAQCVGGRPDALFRRDWCTLRVFRSCKRSRYQPPGTGPSGACASIRV
jgi:hypothetical protein